MYKITLDKTNIHPNKFHTELGTLPLKYHLTHNDDNVFLSFPNIRKVENDVLNEKDEVIDTIVTFQKKHEWTETNIDAETGETTSKQMVEWNDYDFTPIQTTIDDVIAVHDNTPDYEIAYQEKTKKLIREQYTIEQEIGLTNDCNIALMAGESIPQAYIDYRTFVETCKDTAHLEVFGIERT